MGRPMLVLGQRQFAGGLNTVADDANVGADQLRRAENVRLTTFGAVTKRGGMQRLHAAALPAAVRGGFCWRRAASTQLLAVANGLLHTGTYSVGMTWTAQVGALSSSATTSFAAFRDGSGEAVYLADGGGLAKWTGAALSRPAGAATVTYVWVYNQRLFGIDQASETLYWSALNNGDSLGNAGAGGGSATIRTFGASKLMAGATVGGANMLLHAGGLSVFVGYTQDDISISAGTKGVTSVIGAPAPWGVTTLEGALWVPTERGVYLVGPDGARALDSPERPDPTAVVCAALSSADLLRVRVAVARGTQEVWTYLPGTGVYCWQQTLQAWTGPWDGGYLAPDTTALFEAVDTDGSPCVLRGDASGWITRCDAAGIGTDNATSAGVAGSTITASWGPRRLYAVDAEGAPDLMGSLAVRRAFVHADLRGSTQASVTVTTNTAAVTRALRGASMGAMGAFYYDGTMTWDSGWVYDGAGMRPYRVEMGGSGNHATVTITDSGTAESVYAAVQLHGFSLGRLR